MVEQLKTIKDQLITQVQGQMSDLKCVNTKELGEVIDMIKDLAEAVYYCEIYDQMKNSEESRMMTKENNNYYYTERYYEPQRDMDKDWGRMYYSSSGTGTGTSHTGSNSNSSSSPSYSMGENSRSYYTERDYPVYIRDEREGRSPMKRKMFMESKQTGQDKSKSMKELENYMQDLTTDMMEMLEKASPEEKSMV